MKKKKIIIGCFLMSVFTVAMTYCVIGNNNKETDKSQVANCETKSIWTEIEPMEKSYVSCVEDKDMDIRENLEETDYVFRGKIKDCKDYEIEWTDEKGEKWGPFNKSVLSVEIIEDYYGESPVSGNSINVYYPYSSTMEFSNSFVIGEDKEYVFVTKALDDEFIKNRNENNKDDKFEQEKYADVYISNAEYDLMVVEGDKVAVQNDYFIWDDNAMGQTESTDSISKDLVTDNEFTDEESDVSNDENNDWFIVLDKDYFKDAFCKILNNNNLFPNMEEINKIHEELGW